MKLDYHRASADLHRYLPLKIGISVWLFFCLAFYAYAAAATWNGWWPYGVIEVRNLDEAKAAIYAFIGGGLGSTVYSIRGFYWSSGPQRDDEPRYQFDPNFVWWYMFRPAIGAFLGAAVYALVRGGVATFGVSADESSTALAAYFGLAFLAGFALHELLGWITDIGRRLFQTQSAPPTSRPDDRQRRTEDGERDAS